MSGIDLTGDSLLSGAVNVTGSPAVSTTETAEVYICEIIPTRLPITAAELAEQRQRLIAEYDAAEAARDKAETAELLGHVSAIAEAAIARYREAPCHGELAGLPACTPWVWRNCALRDEPSCPRQIRAFDEARDAAHLEERLADAGIPKALLVDAMNPKPTKATAYVDDWLPSNRRILVLAGLPGVGKSVAAAYAIRRYRGRWAKASYIAKVQGFSQEHENARARLKETRLLVIDDLGAENNTDHSRSAIEELIADRYDEGVRTVITTNLDAKQFKAAYTARIRDRIIAERGYEWCDGPSLRGAR
jgi:DNA replication protein DnaC